MVGAAPYTDGNPQRQIDRVIRTALEFDIDIDMHLDFGPDAEHMDMNYVCELTDCYGYGGRVAIGHVTKLALPPRYASQEQAQQLASSEVAVTVLPATDLYLMGRHQDHSIMRGVSPAHHLLGEGVNCSLSTNNVLNPELPCLSRETARPKTQSQETRKTQGTTQIHRRCQPARGHFRTPY